MSQTTETPTLREMLDTIDGWFLSPEGGKLADVLSATRGPDNSTVEGSLNLKSRTTNPVRRMAFPKTYESADILDFGRWAVNPHNDVYDHKTAIEGGDHFANHIYSAMAVLTDLEQSEKESK